jgi:Na+/H+-dicarboxylate symporter
MPVIQFLDRFRTMINVTGDLCVSCVLDGKSPPSAANHVNIESEG